MVTYIVRRIIIAVFTLWAISFLTYIIAQLPPGDFAERWIYMQWNLGNFKEWPTPEEEYAIREGFGMNRPLVVQYGDWIWGIVSRADFGQSYGPEAGITASGFGLPVRNQIVERLPYTIYLTAFTMLITWSFAIPVGIYSAVRQHSIGDYTFTFLGFTGLAVPDFLLGLVLMYVAFAYFSHSVGGIFSGEYLNAPWSFGRVIDMLQHLIIPAIVLGTAGTAGLIRIMRNNLLDELNKPYVVTARSKGLVNWKLIVKYPVRVAINPFVSGIGNMLPALVGGSVIVSVVLSLPTLGPLLLYSLQVQDANMIGAIILLLASLTVIGTLISDLLLVVVDPRIKLTGR